MTTAALVLLLLLLLATLARLAQVTDQRDTARREWSAAETRAEEWLTVAKRAANRKRAALGRVRHYWRRALDAETRAEALAARALPTAPTPGDPLREEPMLDWEWELLFDTPREPAVVYDAMVVRR